MFDWPLRTRDEPEHPLPPTAAASGILPWLQLDEIHQDDVVPHDDAGAGDEDIARFLCEKTQGSPVTPAATLPAMTFDRDLFKRALDFAAAKHGNQTVPGSGFPYVVHITKVAMEVVAVTEEEAGFDRDLALACALLHDTIEDAKPIAAANAIRAEIRRDFGTRVADGVEALTKTGSGPKADQMRDSLRRIRTQPREVWLVKLADRITNLEPPPAEWPLEKRGRYLEEAREILAQLGSASPALSRRFEQKLVEYREFCEQ